MKILHTACGDSSTLQGEYKDAQHLSSSPSPSPSSSPSPSPSPSPPSQPRCLARARSQLTPLFLAGGQSDAMGLVRLGDDGDGGGDYDGDGDDDGDNE